MPRNGPAYLRGYNAQAAVGEGQIVLACDVVIETNDRHQLVPMLAAARQVLATVDCEDGMGDVLADAGPLGTDALEAVVVGAAKLIVNAATSNPRRPHNPHNPLYPGRSARPATCRS